MNWDIVNLALVLATVVFNALAAWNHVRAGRLERATARLAMDQEADRVLAEEARRDHVLKHGGEFINDARTRMLWVPTKKRGGG